MSLGTIDSSMAFCIINGRNTPKTDITTAAIATYISNYQGAWIGSYRNNKIANNSTQNTADDKWYWIGGPEAGGPYAVNGESLFSQVTGSSGGISWRPSYFSRS